MWVGVEQRLRYIEFVRYLSEMGRKKGCSQKRRAAALTRWERSGKGIGINTDMNSFPAGWYALAKSTGPGGAYEMIIHGPNG